MKRIHVWLLLMAVFCGTIVAQSKPQALTITHGPVVEKTTGTSAVIAWTTNTGGSSVIRYGTDRNNLSQTAQAPYADNEAVGHQTHRVAVKNLTPGTTYYFAVDSGQGEGTGTEAKGQIAQFTTQGKNSGQNGAQALTITHGPVVEKAADTWAVIAWTTNTGGSSIIRYGTGRNNLTQTAQAPYADNEAVGHQTHRVTIKNLNPATTYFYMVDSGQGEGTGTEVKGQIAQFSTEAGSTQAGMKKDSLRLTHGPVVEKVGNNWATIAWTTNTGGSSIVKYGTDSNNLSQTAQAPYADNEAAGHQTHRVQLKNLTPNTNYFFMVDSGQGEGTGTEVKGTVGQFKTKAQ